MADCLKVVDTANAGRLSDQELEDILTELQNEKKARQAAGALENVEAGIFERGQFIVNEADIARKIEKRNRYMNILREQNLMALADRADQMTGDPSLGIEAALVGVNAPFEGASRSVDALNQALVNQYVGGMVADLKKANLLVRFNNMTGEFEREVSRVLADLNLKKPTRDVKASADAKKIGEILFKYQRTALQRENRAGSYIRLKEGRVVRASHDQRRMVKVGKEEWSTFINQRIDWDRTAGGEFAAKSGQERLEFLSRSYDAIVSGVRKEGERTEISRAFKGPGNLAKRQSESGVFTFKDADTWYDYDQKFGRASLREAFLQDLQSSARATALMENLGTNPQAMVEKVQKRLEEKYRGDAKKLSRIKRERAAITFDAALAEVTGDVNIGSHTSLARYLHFYRSLQTMAKLGGAWISALSDVAFIASNRIYQGRSLMGAWNDGLTAVFRGMNKGEMREFADRLGVGLEAQLGDFMSRFNAADDVAGQTSKMMSLFFKLNLLQPWTESNKRGVTLMIANDLGREASKSYAKLPDDLKRVLGIYGIDEAKWNVARKGATKGPDGRVYLVPGEIDDVNVRESFFALLTSEADNSVPSPGARERAAIRRGYRPGTFAGEGIRFLTQFKSFGVTALTKNLGRHMYGYGARNMRDQMMRGVGANMGIINSVVGTTVLGYYVMQLKEVMKGREMREPSPEAFIAAALQGGGLGIYGDFLFGEANRFGGGTLETLAGPGVGTATELVDLLQRTRGVVTGGDEDLRGDYIRLLKGNVPFANLFYTKQAMDYLIWYQLQETVNPGYLRRMERRIERENNQEFWLPPSSIVKTGGGFR